MFRHPTPPRLRCIRDQVRSSLSSSPSSLWIACSAPCHRPVSSLFTCSCRAHRWRRHHPRTPRLSLYMFMPRPPVAASPSSDAASLSLHVHAAPTGGSVTILGRRVTVAWHKRGRHLTPLHLLAVLLALAAVTQGLHSRARRQSLCMYQ